MNSNEQNKNKISSEKNNISFNDKQNLFGNQIKENKGKTST